MTFDRSHFQQDCWRLVDVAWSTLRTTRGGRLLHAARVSPQLVTMNARYNYSSSVASTRLLYTIFVFFREQSGPTEFFIMSESRRGETSRSTGDFISSFCFAAAVEVPIDLVTHTSCTTWTQTQQIYAHRTQEGRISVPLYIKVLGDRRQSPARKIRLCCRSLTQALNTAFLLRSKFVYQLLYSSIMSSAEPEQTHPPSRSSTNRRKTDHNPKDRTQKTHTLFSLISTSSSYCCILRIYNTSCEDETGLPE